MARTEERDHATALAREAVATSIEAGVVLGADGTINEAANGLVGSGTALAVLPGGMTKWPWPSPPWACRASGVARQRERIGWSRDAATDQAA